MRTTQILLDEHRCIDDMLECLDLLGEQCRREDRLDVENAVELLVLFDSFADGLHQRKEEDVLFPLLLDRANPAQEEILSDLVDEHHEEWAQMQDMRAGLERALSGEDGSLPELGRLIQGFVALQRAHVRRENEALLPMAERMLGTQDDEDVARRFHELEVAGPDMSGVFEQVRTLCRRLGVAVER